MNPSDVEGFGEIIGGLDAKDDESLVEGGGCSRVGHGMKIRRGAEL